MGSKICEASTMFIVSDFRLDTGLMRRGSHEPGARLPLGW